VSSTLIPWPSKPNQFTCRPHYIINQSLVKFRQLVCKIVRYRANRTYAWTAGPKKLEVALVPLFPPLPRLPLSILSPFPFPFLFPSLSFPPFSFPCREAALSCRLGGLGSALATWKTFLGSAGRTHARKHAITDGQPENIMFPTHLSVNGGIQQLC